jgi:acetyl esterase/lipase
MVSEQRGFFLCRVCGVRYRWRTQLAGKKVQCRCGLVMMVPAEPPYGQGEQLRSHAAEASVAVVTAAVTAAVAHAAGATSEPAGHRLWPGKAPLAAGDEPADVPRVVVYHAEHGDGSAIVVCPGGGYQNLAPHEAEPIARWLNTLGITGIVLSYRLAPRYRYPAAFLDVSRAIRTARAKAGEWQIDPKRIGVLGFSAGGHLSATVSTVFDSDERDSADATDQQSARPDVSVLLYPVITLDGVSAHVGSRGALLGEKPTRAMLDQLSCERHVSPHTPPTFVFHTVADQGVPVENAMLYAAALRKAGIAFEMHLFEPGKHGVGLAKEDPVLKAWPALCATWLKSHGLGR